MSGANPYASLAAEAVAALSPYEPGMPPEALEREYGVRDAIKLASNENPLGTPASVIAAMETALRDVRRYPDGGAFALHEALADHLGVSTDQLTLGNGSNDTIRPRKPLRINERPYWPLLAPTSSTTSTLNRRRNPEMESPGDSRLHNRK